jgi:hypothetical protein
MISARRLAVLVISTAFGGVVFGAAPAHAVSPDAVALSLAQRFDVKILRVTPIERDGKSLYAVVVMNPGGNFNEAFKVTTLVVDAETGDLVAQFRDEDSGYHLPPAANRQPPADESGAAIRRETFRGR